MRQLSETGGTSADSGFLSRLRRMRSGRGDGKSNPIWRLSVLLGIAGLLGYLSVLSLYEPGTGSFTSWTILLLASALLASVTFRIDRPGRESYYIDFDEFLLVVGLQYLAPAATIAALVGGYVVGAFLRRVQLYKTGFNTASRLVSLSGAFMVAGLLPLDWQSPGNFLLFAVVVAAFYTIINQVLISLGLSVVGGSTFIEELRSTIRGESTMIWPIMVSFGLLTVLASREYPFALLIAVVPLLLLIVMSHTNQARRDEHQRMQGLYGAAQLMHGANSVQEVVRVLQQSVEATLGVPGTFLRNSPPYGDELGAWLPNRKQWIIVPYPSSRLSRRQDEAFLQAIASLVDASMDRTSLVGELERHSFRDPLTNAYNRRFLEQKLDDLLQDGETEGCLALIDIDYFKVINDTHGHAAGDDSLVRLVETVKSTFRSDDIVCRLGGDEFAVLLPTLSPERVIARMNDLQARLRQDATSKDGRHLHAFTISVGIAAFPRDGRSFERLSECADEALYQAKRGGRDQVVRFRGEKAPDRNLRR